MKLAQAWLAALVAVAMALGTVGSVAAQGPAEPATAGIEVTVWRRVSNPSLLYLSTRPEGGSWRTENTALDMSALSSSGRFHQSNAVTVSVPLPGGGTATVEVTVWRRVSNPSLLYLSTRPEGGSWHTENAALDMSARSSSGRFHQSNAVLVDVPLPDLPDPPGEPEEDGEAERVCRWNETAERVVASTVKVSTPTVTGSAFYVGNGQFVTAGHVVEDRPSHITLGNEHVSTAARLVGFYEFDSGDVALLSALAPSLTALEWAGTLTIGTDIAIAGYPEALGTTASWTRGTVSRVFTAGGVSYLQTDAASSPGNSGGPLVDACGRVAGIISSSYVGERGSEGLHFAVAEPTMSRRLIALGLRGYVVAPGGSVPEGGPTISAGPQLDRYYGAVRFRVPLGSAYSYEAAPEGTVVRATVGGEACGTDTTVTRFGKAQFSLTVEEGCGGAEPGVLVTFTVNGQQVGKSVYWGSSQEINLDVVPPEREPTWEDIDTYVSGVLERWEEALANIHVTLANERPYYWRPSDGYGRGGIWQSLYPQRITWAGWVVQVLTPSRPGPVALRSEAVESWRAAAHTYWTAYDTFLRKWSVNDGATDFYRERRDAVWPTYRQAECALWEIQGYTTSDELCAEGP